MSNKAYDTMKLISLIIAPIATFTAALSQIWNIPYGAQITATIAAADVLMGAIVTIAKRNYDKEQITAPEEKNEEEN
jgi:hypothetical protein